MASFSYDEEYDKLLLNAMFSPEFPCNPIPFAKGLTSLLRAQGTQSIRGDDAKRILWVLMAQAYGQDCEVINLTSEYMRLVQVANAQEEDGEVHDG